MAPELAGPLLPHGHGQTPTSFSPGHERARGIEWRSITETVRLLQRESRAAAVDQHALPVQIWPSPPPAREKQTGNGSQHGELTIVHSIPTYKDYMLLTLFSLLTVCLIKV